MIEFLQQFRKLYVDYRSIIRYDEVENIHHALILYNDDGLEKSFLIYCMTHSLSAIRSVYMF